jgi:tetratricopeptide (TPR) repeat protein
MLETIRQFAEDQLVASGAATEVRAAHARYFAGREADILALWDSPRQREAYDWFTVELANLRTAFRWSADHSDLDVAATIATYAAWLGILGENYEPIAWAEEVIEPARAVGHTRLAFLCAVASLCWMAGRFEAAVCYADACESVLRSGRADVPFGINGLIGSSYLTIGEPERYVDVARAQFERGRDTLAFARSGLAMALTVVGSRDEAITVATGLIDAAEATRNPYALSLALLADAFAFREADPVRALDALHRGLRIAQDNGQRANETHLAVSLAQLEAERGDRLAALDHLTLAMRNYHDSGNTAQMHSTLAFLAVILDRLGRYESATTLAGFALSPFATMALPEFTATITHLRDVLGEATYESLARKGETMTTAAMVTYAYDQIDQVRAELEAVSE